MTAEALLSGPARPAAPAAPAAAPCGDAVLATALRALRDGDGDALETVMIRSERRLARLAWRVLGDAEEVREALQETYLRVFRHAARYDADRDPWAWLARVAINVCRDLERRRRPRRGDTELSETLALPAREHPDAVAARGEEVAQLIRAVDALPPKQRLALVLRDLEGLSTAEVARVLGSREATVRVHLFRARARVRALIEGWRVGVTR